MTKIEFKGNEIVLMDDSSHYDNLGSARRIIEKTINLAFKNELSVISAVTKEMWDAVHNATGKPLLVLHDWDISDLLQDQHFHYTTETSIKNLLKKGYQVIVYSGSAKKSLDEWLNKNNMTFIQKGVVELPTLCKYINELLESRTAV